MSMRIPNYGIHGEQLKDSAEDMLIELKPSEVRYSTLACVTKKKVRSIFLQCLLTPPIHRIPNIMTYWSLYNK